MPVSRRALLASGLALPLAPRLARAAKRPGQLTFALSSYPPNIAPWTNSGTASVTVKYQIYRGLTSYDAQGAVRPELAERWERVGDTGWLFHLREAVFHNGAPVTSADVKWTLEQVGAEKSTASLAAQFRGVERIETPDPRKVLVVMKDPLVVLPEWLAGPHMPIIQKGSTENGGTPVGAGPYRLKSQERGVSLELEAFDRFYKPGLPKVKAIRMVAYADENLRVAALQTGDVDLIEYVPWQSMNEIERDPGLKLDNQDGPFMALAFNGTRGPFGNPLVRQAVAFAIRREEIVKAAFFGRGNVLAGMPVLPSSPFYDAARSHYWAYDPDRSKALLAKAGLAQGFSATLLSTAQYGMHKSTAEVVQQHLGEVGIQVQLSLPDWGTRVSLGFRGQYDFTVQGSTADNNDPDGLATLMDGELPMSNARSVNLPTPEIHALFQQGRAEFDLERRKAIYARLETLVLETCPWVGLAWRAQGYAMAKDVMGFRGLPGAVNFYSGLMLEETYFG